MKTQILGIGLPDYCPLGIAISSHVCAHSHCFFFQPDMFRNECLFKGLKLINRKTSMCKGFIKQRFIQPTSSTGKTEANKYCKHNDTYDTSAWKQSYHTKLQATQLLSDNWLLGSLAHTWSSVRSPWPMLHGPHSMLHGPWSMVYFYSSNITSFTNETWYVDVCYRCSSNM